MVKKSILIVALVTLASCGSDKSATLGKYGDYVTVPDNWRESVDAMDGPKKLLSYTARSDAGGTFVAGCTLGRDLIAYFDANPLGASAPLGLPFHTSIKLDDGSPIKLDMNSEEGARGLFPSSNNSDTAEFLARLADHSSLVFRIDDMGGGIPITDPPATFNIQGAEEVTTNLKRACAAS